MKLQQTSIDQTGAAIFELANSKEKIIPLFSVKPIEEAEELSEAFSGATLKNVFITNNLVDYKIEEEIKRYKDKHDGALSEDFMDQLATGFPYIQGFETKFDVSWYY